MCGLLINGITLTPYNVNDHLFICSVNIYWALSACRPSQVSVIRWWVKRFSLPRESLGVMKQIQNWLSQKKLCEGGVGSVFGQWWGRSWKCPLRKWGMSHSLKLEVWEDEEDQHCKSIHLVDSSLLGIFCVPSIFLADEDTWKDGQGCQLLYIRKERVIEE